MITRILHATDLSPASRPALRLAAGLARALEAELVLFHAYHPLERLPGAGSVPARTLAAAQAKELAKARSTLDRMARSLRKRRVRATACLEEGPAVGTIIRVARRRRAGLVVLATRGRGTLARLLAGSVAQQVLRGVRRPVLIVPARRP